MEILAEVCAKLQERTSCKFIPLKVREILNKVKNSGLEEEVDDFIAEAHRLYEVANQYLESWLKPLQEFQCFHWMKLSNFSSWEFERDISPSLIYLQAKGVEIDDAVFFDQVSGLRKYLERLPEENLKQSCHKIWCDYFNSCASTECFTEMLKVVQFFFAITAHNANVERVFSLIQAQWTKERNRLLVDSVKGIILTTYNFQAMDCADFYSYVLKCETLLEKIDKEDKYLK